MVSRALPEKPLRVAILAPISWRVPHDLIHNSFDFLPLTYSGLVEPRRPGIGA
jgi:hypothetical protein